MKQTDKPEESEENLNAGAMHETQVLAVVTQECWAQQESLGCRRRFWRRSTAREYAGGPYQHKPCDLAGSLEASPSVARGGMHDRCRNMLQDVENPQREDHRRGQAKSILWFSPKAVRRFRPLVSPGPVLSRAKLFLARIAGAWLCGHRPPMRGQNPRCR